MRCYIGISIADMRVISKRRLLEYWETHPDTELALRAWYEQVNKALWRNTQDVRARYPSASFVGRNRVVFNIKGNKHRLIVAVAYQYGAVYIKFVGTHAEYDKIDAATLELE